MRYPPGYTPEWETRLSTTDFQLIARTADDLGYDAIQVPEHIVMPNDLATMMGAYWPHRSPRWRSSRARPHASR